MSLVFTYIPKSLLGLRYIGTSFLLMGGSSLVSATLLES